MSIQDRKKPYAGTGNGRESMEVRYFMSRFAGRMRLLTASIALLGVSVVMATPSMAEQPGLRTVKIDPGGAGPVSQNLSLSLNKSAIIDLPADAHDILVSNPEIAEAVIRTSRRSYLMGLKVGYTNVFYFDRQGNQILNLEVTVERDLTALRETLKQYLPEAQIEVTAMNDHLILSGIVPDVSQASQAANIAGRYVGNDEQVLNMTAIEAKEQVLVRVTVAEMQRSLIKQLGLNWDFAGAYGNWNLLVSQINPLSVAGQALGGIGAGAGFAGGRTSANALFQAFERNGLVRTLAEPNLTAISGESANFLAGGEFPVPSSQDQNGNVVLEFKPFGVGLGFTPVVLSEGRISMKISTEVSDLTTDGAFVLQRRTARDEDDNVIIIEGVTIPALKVRRAETTVELPSGGSLVMAGLLSQETRQNIDGVPGLKDTPILGGLFKSRDFQNDETELVVIVTPYLVDPVARDDLVLPTDGFAPASDMDTILMGRLNATYGGDNPAEGGLRGPVGFVIE